MGSRERHRSAGCFLLLALLLCCEMSFALAPAVARTFGRSGTAINATRLRAAPDRHAAPLLRLTRGAAVKIYGKPDHGWYRARRGHLEGYVLSGDIATQPGARAHAKRKRREHGTTRDDRSRRQRRARADRSATAELQQSAAGQGRQGDRQRDKGRKGKRRGAREVRTAADLNLRQGPSKNEPVRGVIPKRAKVRLTGKHGNGFVEVRWRRETGWAFGKHLAAPSAAARRDRDPSSWTQQELIDIIVEAADRYGQPREDMLRVANCESRFDPKAVNGPGGSYGLFQFKPGTWRSTPFAAYDIFDPRASANAAAWMWAHGRRREWVCQ